MQTNTNIRLTETVLIPICVAILLSMFCVRFDSNTILKILTYIVEFYMLLRLSSYNLKRGAHYYCNISFVFVSTLLVCNFIISPYSPEYIRLLKYLTYFSCCIYGILLSRNGYILSCRRFLQYILIFSPVVLILMFDNTPKRTMFFTQGNTFTFWGLNCGLLYYVLNEKYDKKAFIKSCAIIILYIFSSTSLGVFASFLIIILLKNRHNVKLLWVSTVLLFVIILLVLYSNIPIFSRIRSVIDVFSSVSFNDLFDPNLSTYELEQMNVDDVSGRNDNASSIWRLKHWCAILAQFFDKWTYAFLGGLGDSFSQKVCGHNPHNDYLRVFAEFGIICFSYVIYLVYKCAKVLFNYPIFYFIGAALIYFGTDNSSDFLPGCSLFFFLVGYYYKNKSICYELKAKYKICSRQ